MSQREGSSISITPAAIMPDGMSGEEREGRGDLPTPAALPLLSLLMRVCLSAAKARKTMGGRAVTVAEDRGGNERPSPRGCGILKLYTTVFTAYNLRMRGMERRNASVLENLAFEHGDFPSKVKGVSDTAAFPRVFPPSPPKGRTGQM